MPLSNLILIIEIYINQEGDQALPDTLSEVKEKRSLKSLLPKTPFQEQTDRSDTYEDDSLVEPGKGPASLGYS